MELSDNSVTGFASSFYDFMLTARQMSPDELPWPLKLIVILLGYSTVAVPAMILIWCVKKKDKSGDFQPRSIWTRFLRQFALGLQDYLPLESDSKKSASASESPSKFWNDLGSLAIYFSGIQVTLVMMGFLQERIITQGYVRIDDIDTIDRFGDAQFLVFCNRIVALLICGVVLSYNWSRQPPHVPPLYVHSYTSFSNTISSWCQYEALKYVSFPTQTICKASKVVVTMAMGTFVRGKKYSVSEYACGGGIAMGASLFLLSTKGGITGDDTSTSLSGLLLMAGYLIFDAFTLNWQKSLFDTRPKVSKYQMMLGVNAFSAILCVVSLIEQGTLFPSMKFAMEHQTFSTDCFLLSLSGATGQLFIYSTIQKFGPIVFAVIMTIRQMLSIVLSAVYYGHPMSVWAILGFSIVFGSMFTDIYRRYFEKSSPEGNRTSKEVI